MERLRIDNYDALAYLMHDKAIKNKTTYAILFYDEAIELLRSLMMFYDIDVNSIDIATGEYNGYYKEYIVSVSSDMLIDVEPAWREYDNRPGGYVYIDNVDAIYIDREANSSIVHGVCANCYELLLNDEDYGDDDAEADIELSVELFNDGNDECIDVPVTLPISFYGDGLFTSGNRIFIIGSSSEEG